MSPTPHTKFRLTATDKERLEAVRVKYDLKTAADALRVLLAIALDETAATPPPVAPAPAKQVATSVAPPVHTPVAPKPEAVAPRNTVVVAPPATCKGGPWNNRTGMTMCETCGKPAARH